MANEEHVAILRQGVEGWNAWRKNNPRLKPDLRKITILGPRFCNAPRQWEKVSDAVLAPHGLARVDLHQADLSRVLIEGVDLSHANLRHASLYAANITDTLLMKANLRHSIVVHALIINSSLAGVNLADADLSSVSMYKVNLNGCKLPSADLSYASMVRVSLHNATLDGCYVYGVSAWDLDLDRARQSNLVITERPLPPMPGMLSDAPVITVDNLEIAQFIYLLLNNQKLRDIIDTITSKVVLILGRFTSERKVVLDALRDDLRKRNYTPVVFDFTKPASRDTVETVSTLAHMARFIIADITDAKSVLQELQAVVPHLPSVPVQPLLLDSQQEPGMFDHIKRRESVLEPYLYTDIDSLLRSLATSVIDPIEAKVKELTGR